MRKLYLILGVIVGFGVAGMLMDSAHARPKYLAEFTTKYPKLEEKAKEAKCGICHPDQDKKIRNDYGKAVGGALPEKNAKDSEKIQEAMDKAAKTKIKEGEEKTFGDVIEAGELPNG